MNENASILKKLYEKESLPEKEMEILKRLDELGNLDAGLDTLGNNKEFIESIKKPGTYKEETPTMMERVKKGAGAGVRMLAEGGAGLAGIAVDPASTIVNQFLPEDYQIGSLKEDVSKILTDFGVPEAETKTERIVQAAGEELVAGLGTAKLAQKGAKLLSGPVTKAVMKVLGEAPTQQAVGAMTGGASQQYAAEEGAGPIAQAIMNLLGQSVGAGAIGLKQTAKRAVRPGRKEAEKLGIETTRTDIMPPKTAAGEMMRKAGDVIPFIGTAGKRARQVDQRLNAIKSVLREHDADELIDVSDDIMKSLKDYRETEITRYTKMKEKIIDRMERKGTVPVPNTLSKIDSEIKRLEKIDPDLNSKSIEILKTYKNAFQDKTLLNVEGVRDMLGDAFTPELLSTVKKQGQKSVNRIYGALKEDLADFIRRKGDKKDIHNWNLANKRLSSMINELEVEGLKSALKKGKMTPESINKMLFSKKPSEIRLLYKNLDEAGRANARTAILLDSLQKSGGMENLSAKKFTENLNKNARSIGIFFKNRELDQVEGLARALKLTEYAEQASKQPFRSQYAPYIATAILADLFGGTFGGAAITTASIGGISRFLESKLATNILAKIPTLKKGSKEEAKLIKRFWSLMRQYETESAEPESTETEMEQKDL